MADKSHESENAIVVGSGLAGIAATCELLELGCTVTLIDKNPRPTTGNSSKASAGIYGAIPDMQRAKGIVDSCADVQEAATDAYSQIMLNKVGDVQWLLESLNEKSFSYMNTVGHPAPRVLSDETCHNSGQALCARAATLFGYLAPMGKLNILRGETVTGLLSKKLEDGSVEIIGVEYCAEEDDSRATKTSIYGRVILCTGGYAGSAEAKRTSGLSTICDPRVDGSCLRLATTVGAEVVRRSDFTLTPYAIAYPGEDINGPQEKFCLSECLVGPGVAIFDGEHLLKDVSTGTPIKDLTKKTHEDICKAMKQGKGPFTLVVAKVPHGTESSMTWYAQNKFVDVFSNMRSLGVAVGVPEDRLLSVFGPVPKKTDVYAVKVTQAVYACCGGLKVGPQGEAVGEMGMIPGLFAAGEAAAGPGVNMYAKAGMPLFHCIVSGRAAAQGAANAIFAGKQQPARKAIKEHFHTLAKSASEEVQAAGPEAAQEQEQNLSEMSKEDLIEMVKKLKAGGASAAPAAPAGPVDDTKYFSLDDIKAHNTKADAYIAVNGEVLDVSAFIDKHPGGEQAIMAYVGKDATAEWNQIHKPGTVEKVGLKLGAKKLGKLGSPPAAGGAAPAGAPAADAGISLDEIAKHNKKDDAWLVVNGDVLDVTGFIDNHPGGVQAIMAMVGKDATADWNAIHKPGLVEKVGLKSGAKIVGKFAGGGAAAAGPTEAPFFDLPPPPEGEPPLFTLSDEYLKSKPKLKKALEFLGAGWIGALGHLLLNFGKNLGLTFLNTGNIRFQSERMGTIRSGLFLVFFTIAHSMDNQTTHLGRVQYNAMTYMMADRIQGDGTAGLAWFDMYIGMAVLLHASVGIKRSWEINMGYTLGSGRWKWLISGLIILTFLIQHLCDFRFAANLDPSSVKMVEAKLPQAFIIRLALTPPFAFFCADDNDPNAWVVTTRDVYTLEYDLFQKKEKVLQYVIFVCALGAHLFWAWPKVITSDALAIPTGHQNRVKYIGWCMAAICCTLYISVPISFYMGIMPAKEGGDSNVCGGMAIPGLALPAIP